eukprot:TRINITY_DN5_c0_g1_i14.p1 TRINITY_DN5_c0_g1~~TRINITY_DN5_c0_g1_i14.p1  ORF type:complete len:1762 (-),score=590.84 TRINITY_DN5_c0_g1_i14:220-5505(-)
MAFMTQFNALLGKNVRTLSRRPIGLLIGLAVPFLLFGFALILKNMSIELNNRFDDEVTCGFIDYEGNFFAQETDCVQLGFYPAGNADVKRVMDDFSAKYPKYSTKGFDTSEHFVSYIFDNMGEVKTGVELAMEDGEWGYDLQVNATYIATPTYKHLLNLQNALESVLASDTVGKTVTLQHSVMPFTDVDKPTNAVVSDSDKNLANSLSGLVIISVFSMCMIVANNITEEKFKHALQMLRMMGLHEMAYWLTWFLSLSVIGILASIAIYAAGYASGFPVFSDCSPLVMIPIIILFVMSFGSFLFACISVTHQPRNTMIFAFIVMAVCIIFNAMTSDDLLNGKDYSAWDKKLDKGAMAFRIIYYFSPIFQFARCFGDVMRVTKYGSLSGDSFDVSMLFDKRGETPLVWSMGIMLIQSGLYLVVTWYVAQVFGGRQRNPLFFITDSRRGATTYVEGDTIAQVQAESAADNSVRTHKLSKAFGAKQAVKELSIQMNLGEVYCLLGHNGAGKSTTINMLSGLHAPTHGDAFVFGHSIKTDIAELQKMMGVCPQHDILFLELTGKEHIKFWAKFKGHTISDSEAIERLKTVNLEHDADRMARNYSGGMLRRLSVCLSSVGNPKIIFLDEPTTGMDPLSRRKIWNTINALKQGRIIVLTTHSMEEADMLGDRISIMSNGHMRASGSSLFLKDRFGSGHHIDLLTDPRNSDAVLNLVDTIIPGTEVVSNSAGNISLSVPRHCVKRLPLFFRSLEDPTNSIQEWAVSSVTLEEVFIKLTQQNKKVNQALETNPMCQVCTKRHAEPVMLYTAQGIAVQIEGICCHECARTPEQEAVEMAANERALEALKHLDTSPAETDGKEYVDEMTPEERDDFDDSINERMVNLSKNRNPSLISQYLAVQMKHWNTVARSKKTFWCAFIGYLIFGFFILTGSLSSGLSVNPVSYQTCTGKDWKGATMEMQGVSMSMCNSTYFKLAFSAALQNAAYTTGEYGLVDTNFNGTYDLDVTKFGAAYQYPELTMSRVLYRDDAKGKPLNTWPILGDAGDLEENNAKFFSVKQNTFSPNDVATNAQNSKHYYDSMFKTTEYFSANYPNYGVDILTAQSDDKSATLKTNVYQWLLKAYQEAYVSAAMYQYGSLDYLRIKDQDSVAPSQNKYVEASKVHHALNNGFLRSIDKDLGIYSTLTVFSSKDLIHFQVNKNSDNVSTAAMAIQFLAMIFFPYFVSQMTSEKSDGLYHYLRMQGMKLPAYHLGNHGFFTLIAFFLAFSFVLLNIFIGTDCFKQHPIYLYVAATFIWSYGMASFGMLIAAVTSNRRQATLISYFLLVCGLVFANVGAQDNANWSVALQLTPWFNGLRLIGSVIAMVGASTTDIHNIMLYNFISGTVCFGVAVVMFSITRDLDRAKRIFFKILCMGFNKQKKGAKAPLLSPYALETSGEMDSDVLEHKKEVQACTKTNDYAIFLRNFHKVYPGTANNPPKVAVKELNLAIGKNECFGLLGPNGAGKTTTLSVLSGISSHTGGDAKVMGFDVQTQMDEIFKVLCLCPQFDKVWDYMTVKDHLTMIARLKGISSKEIEAEVRQVAEQTELDGDAFMMLARELSGGMKRRLSIGMTLLGQPPIIFLDEPTTGLDPETRNGIWKTIERCKRDRCVVLVSHSMEEVDALCTRVGIMATGSMRCIGTPLHLKAKFGSGYQLKVNLAKGSSDIKLSDFLRSLCEASTIVYSFGDSRTYRIPAQISVAELFKVMDERMQDLNVKEWSISHTSLDEVFVNIVQD